ncbi:MAG: hypothetical protein ABGY09_01230 [Euryarchaeota archaeon]
MGTPEARACVVDATHGGVVLSDFLHGLGLNVVLVDVYDTFRDPREYPVVRRAFGAYDLVAVPVHCGVDYGPVRGPRVTHHALSGALASGIKEGPLFEVTGVRGKTTTATYLARILEEAGHDPALSTTDESPVGRPSVTPARVLEVVRDCRPPYVCEVSLGITPAADWAVFTGAPYDYRIAGDRRSAVRAKVRTILEAVRMGSRVVVASREAVRIGLRGPGIVRVKVGPGRARAPGLSLEWEPFGVEFHDRCFGLAAVVAVLSGLADREDVSAARARGFVRGRLELREGELVDAHPAVNEETVEYALRVASERWDRFGLVIGGDPGGYCEGVDAGRVARVVERWVRSGRVVGVRFVGELGRRVRERLRVRVGGVPEGAPVVRVIRKGD